MCLLKCCKGKAEKAEKTFGCPRCSNFLIVWKLRKVKHPKGIMLDVCDRCGGMWVDGNEIDALYGKVMPEVLRGKSRDREKARKR